MEGTQTPALKPAAHQVGGHMAADQTPQSLTDDRGRFYKPYQPGSRAVREVCFYKVINGEEEPQSHTQWGPPGCVPPQPEDMAALKPFLPKYFGTTVNEDKHYVVMEDICSVYKNPCVVDAKLGLQTWYPWADQAYIEKNRAKDAVSTQGSTGISIAGLQVYSMAEGMMKKQDRQWGKTLNKDTIHTPFEMFANNGTLTPAVLYAAPGMALDKLKSLLAVFESQRSFAFYQASVLMTYEGTAKTAEEANLQVRFVDFAHTYCTDGTRGCDNILAGMRSLVEVVSRVAGSA